MKFAIILQFFCGQNNNSTIRMYVCMYVRVVSVRPMAVTNERRLRLSSTVALRKNRSHDLVVGGALFMLAVLGSILSIDQFFFVDFFHFLAKFKSFIIQFLYNVNTFKIFLHVLKIYKRKTRKIQSKCKFSFRPAACSCSNGNNASVCELKLL